MPEKQRRTVIFYIDGFNLYNGAVRRTPHKWLDLQAMCTKLRVDDDVLRIKYFTSLVFGRQSQERQLRYLRALGCHCPLFESHMGAFKNTTIKCRHGVCTYAGDRDFETVVEKRTDVNIAVAMVGDAYLNACDVLAVVSGDSDLVPAVERVRSLGKKVAIYAPVRPDGETKERRADELKKAASTGVDLPQRLLAACQLPGIVVDRDRNPIPMPAEWAIAEPAGG